MHSMKTTRESFTEENSVVFTKHFFKSSRTFSSAFVKEILVNVQSYELRGKKKVI